MTRCVAVMLLLTALVHTDLPGPGGYVSVAPPRAQASWRLSRQGPADAIEGFADRTSVAPGAPFGLYVRTTAPRWRVTAYRIGWYDGADARAIWASHWHRSRHQPAPVTSWRTRTITAPWHRSLTVRTAGWPPGAYLLKLHSAQNYERYVPITVRSPTLAGRVVFVAEDQTWQAYNAWGGRSLYTGPGGYTGRSYAVSFDRPYDHDGAGKFLYFERALIVRAERLGLPMAYTTDIRLSEDPGAAAHARAIVTPGHEEYWTWNQRRAYLRARRNGANLAFFGANTQYWQVRLAATALGRGRTEICYKTDEWADPDAWTERASTLWTALPRPEPESRLVGLSYGCFPAEAPYVVRRPEFFGFRGTGARRGSSYPGLVGVEIDRVDPASAPRHTEAVARSPAWCAGTLTFSDSSYYVAASGAGVFATGTMRWVDVLGGGGHRHGVTGRTIRFVRTVTDNILRAFATGPAGRRYPVPDPR